MAAAAVVAAAFPQIAVGADWQAQYIGQCCNDATLESGETATDYFDAENVGANTWYRDFVKLGTAGPGIPASGHDRASLFYNAATWASSSRPAHLDQSSLSPGQIGRFTFVVKAPSVSQPTNFYEYFEPVAEGIAWMGGWSGWAGAYIPYTVIPPAPPSVRIASSPSRVPAGSPVKVSATASDNRIVDHVTFVLGRESVTVGTANAGPNTYAATLSTAGMQPGSTTVFVTAFDKAGYQSQSTTSFELYAPDSRPDIDPKPPLPPGPGHLGRLERIEYSAGTVRDRLKRIMLTSLRHGVKVRVLCVRKCSRALDRRINAHHSSATLNLDLPLRRGTIIRLETSHPGYLGRFLMLRYVGGVPAFSLTRGCTSNTKTTRLQEAGHWTRVAAAVSCTAT